MPIRSALLGAIVAIAACGGSGAEVAADTTEGDATTASPATSAAPVTTASPDARRVVDGDTVRVHYTGTLEDGTVFDSSEGREPLEFVVASGQVIAGFDVAVRGLAVGETRTQRIEPVDGYGEADPAAIIDVPLEQIPDGTVAGDTLVAGNGQQVTVIAIDEAAGMATIDTNFFLAGKVLIFDVELVEIVGA